jgi:arylsulfatase
MKNVVYFHVDNLGFGELGCYGGGLLRGTETKRIDAFSKQGFTLLNFAPEAQCTPSRTALMTGRYAIRTGNHTVSGSGSEGGLVAWEKTLGDMFSEADYATLCLGKWHVGDSTGRWPCDHGFDRWYGPPHSWDDALWELDPWYVPERDGEGYVLRQEKGSEPYKSDKLTFELKRNIDEQFLAEAREFINTNAGKKPFFLYYNPTLMHLPNVPRDQFKGVTGNGPWADCLLQLDTDFGALLDMIDHYGITDDTIVVLAGDNGNEAADLHRGSSGPWDGTYFTGMEASLRTPCIIRAPGQVAEGRVSNEIFHITDMFTTLLALNDIPIPDDRIIDGLDQTKFLSGESELSARDGFLFWNGPELYGAKWMNFKCSLYVQRSMFDPALKLSFPRITNLMTDQKEVDKMNPLWLHSWTIVHFADLVNKFTESLEEEAPIPAGAPLNFVPVRGDEPKTKLEILQMIYKLRQAIPKNWSG